MQPFGGYLSSFSDMKGSNNLNGQLLAVPPSRQNPAAAWSVTKIFLWRYDTIKYDVLFLTLQQWLNKIPSNATTILKLVSMCGVIYKSSHLLEYSAGGGDAGVIFCLGLMGS